MAFLSPTEQYRLAFHHIQLSPFSRMVFLLVIILMMMMMMMDDDDK